LSGFADRSGGFDRPKKERIDMKIKIMALLVISGLLVGLQAGLAAPDAEKTITGDGACAQCVLKETKECQHTITAEEGGKKVTYYLTQNKVAKEFGNQLCAEKKKVTATGMVKTVAGKQILLPTKIELAKD
jgi:hypothetical protein